MFRRGFKTWCENISHQQRKKFNLKEFEPLDPYQLADNMGVIIWRPEEIPGVSKECLEILLVSDPESWSALTITSPGKSAIVINSKHTHGRTGSNLMHELSHIILGHEAARVDVSSDNLLILSTFDKTQEDEADWLSGCLLLPRAALVHITAKKLSISEVKSNYYVSEQMFNYRKRITGVDKQFKRKK